MNDRTSSPSTFFSVLPLDWRESILPVWPEYKDSTKVLTIEKQRSIIAGGLVFSKPTPDTFMYLSVAENLFNKGFLYLAYIWVVEQHRGKGLGLLWLNELIKKYPEQKFWLAIEEFELHHFYEKCGFILKDEITLSSGSEWIMTRD